MKRLYILVSVLILTKAAIAQLPSYVDTTGLLAWYPFDSSLVNAYGAPMNNGQVWGNVHYGTDRFGNHNRSYLGNGRSLVNIPVHDFPLGNAGRSVSLFFKLDTTYPGDPAGGRTLFSWGSNITGHRFGVFTTATMIGLEYENAYVTRSYVPDTFWHHLVVTYPAGGTGSSSVKVYFDGALTTSYHFLGSIGSFSTDTGVWHGVGGSIYYGSSFLDSWHGYIDDVGIWGRELSGCEVKHITDAFPAHPPIIRMGDTLSTLSGCSSYQWFLGTSSITGATSSTFVASASGVYKVVFTDSIGCSDTSLLNNFTLATATKLNTLQNSLVQVYPNPVVNKVTFVSPARISTLNICNLLGQTVFSDRYDSNDVELDVSKFLPGIYFIMINGTEAGKFVKQ